MSSCTYTQCIWHHYRRDLHHLSQHRSFVYCRGSVNSHCMSNLPTNQIDPSRKEHSGVKNRLAVMIPSQGSLPMSHLSISTCHDLDRSTRSRYGRMNLISVGLTFYFAEEWLKGAVTIVVVPHPNAATCKVNLSTVGAAISVVIFMVIEAHWSVIHPVPASFDNVISAADPTVLIE